eukprot:scaffold82388_cov35-Tisochrysis_lutea.AAC.1
MQDRATLIGTREQNSPCVVRALHAELAFEKLIELRVRALGVAHAGSVTVPFGGHSPRTQSPVALGLSERVGERLRSTSAADPYRT